MMATYYLIFALQCLFPIFQTAGDYLGVSIVNTDVAPHEFAVTAISSDGKSTQTGRITLSAGRQRAFLLPEVVGAGSPTAGWIHIDSDGVGCPVYTASGNDQALAGTDADQSGGKLLWLPHISINTGFMELAHTDAHISIVNAGVSAANVT